METFAKALDLVIAYGPYLGPALLVIAFFLWKDWKREQRLSDRIDALEREMREVVLPLAKDNAAIIAANTAVMIRLEKFLERHT